MPKTGEYLHGVLGKTEIEYQKGEWISFHSYEIPFLVRSQPNVDGFCSNMGHFKAFLATERD